ncbi:MAG: DDE-type integrase/transposase/recombinase [Planctomycetota bacterium]
MDEVFVKINGEMHCLWRAVRRAGNSLLPFRRRQRHLCDRTDSN